MTILRTKQGALTERVARLLLGSPGSTDPEAGKSRFGEITVNLKTGRFFDEEDETGGDHLDLIRRLKKVENGEALRWLDENIFNVKPELPKEFETERLLLALLAAKPEMIDAIEEDVTADNFGLILHRQIFEAIASNGRLNDRPISMDLLIKACGGDPLMPIEGADGINVAGYIARMTVDAVVPPDGAHFARELAAKVRSDANREGGIDDDYDVDPEPEPFISQFGGIPFEHLDDPGPEHEHVIDGLITVGDKSVIGGASRSGKSFLAIHMAMSIATGKSFFGRKIIKPGLVIYQAGEGGRGIKKRFRAWRKTFGVPESVPVFILQSRVDIHSEQGDTGKLISEVQGVSRLYGMPIVAMFIDTLQKASGGADENSGRDMGIVMGNIDRIADAVPGCHVCLVHHMNAGGTKLRGHTSVYAGVDQVILVVKPDNGKTRTATLDKQKDDEDGAQIQFDLMQVEVGRRASDGAPITSCILVEPGTQMQVAGAGAREDRTLKLSDDQTNIYDALMNAINESGIPTPPALKLPRIITKVCKVEDWFRAYRAVASKDEPAIRQAMLRASDRFIKLRLIGRINPYVWPTSRSVANLRANAPGSTAGGGAPFQDEFPELEASDIVH